MKKRFTLLTALLLSAVAIGCGGRANLPAAGQSPTGQQEQASEQLSQQEPQKEPQKEPIEAPQEQAEDGFAIIFTNDVHGYYGATDANFGHDYLAAIADGYRDKYPAVFILDAGDATQGTFFVNDNQGMAAIEIMNAAGYDAMALGNHEFDFGLENLYALKDAADFTFLSQADGFTPYIVLERGGIKIGVFGITTANTKRSSRGGFDLDFGTADSMLLYAKDCVDALKNEGADYIIALTHLGVIDTGEGTSYDIRDNVFGIDLIIDGHSHTKLYDIVQDPDKAPIVSTGEYGNAVGIFETDGHIAKYNIWPRAYFSGLTPDAAVGAVIDKWQAAADKKGETIIAKSGITAEYDRNITRTTETALGNLVADAVRVAAGADIAFVNAGNIRATLEAGDITIKDAYSILPYINNMLAAKVKGSVIKEALEKSVAALPNPTGGFLQVSGVAFAFNDKGITKITVGDKALDENTEYILATSDYLASGGDGYDMMTEAFMAAVPLKEENVSTITDAFVWYLNTLPEGYAPQIEGRILQK